jgi:hypothetical protein
MKIILSDQRRWMWLWLPILACQLLPNKVWAADRLGTPLVEVIDLVQRPPPLVGRQIGVSGLVFCLDHLHCALGSPAGTTQAINIGTQSMRKEDKRRLARQCSQAPCSIILVGTFTRGTFAATTIYDAGELLVPSPTPSTPTKDGSLRNYTSRI